MNTGKALFAQLMDFLPWTDFHADRRPVWRRSPGPDAFPAPSNTRSMAFSPADLPGKPMRDIETCLSVHASNSSITWASASRSERSTLSRCQRKARLAYPCGVGPAAHHPGEDAVRRTKNWGLGPDQYASTPWTRRPSALCLSVFPCGALPHQPRRR